MKKKTIAKIIGYTITAILIFVYMYLFMVDRQTVIPDEIKKQIEEEQEAGIKIEAKEFMSRQVFIIEPKEQKSEKVILYFHGGAYMAEATKEHWEFLKKLVKDTKATVIMPDYPLSPKYTYKDVLNFVEPVYKEIASNVQPQNLIIMGDSAGGGITLGLAEKISQNGIQMPAKTILISPWLDTTMSNPKIEEVQKNDKDLTKDKLTLAGSAYSYGLTEEENYFVNPINGNLSKLKNVTIYTGTYDILNPDCYILQEKAKEVGVEITIKEYQTAPHIWIVNNNHESAEKAYQDMLQELK